MGRCSLQPQKGEEFRNAEANLGVGRDGGEVRQRSAQPAPGIPGQLAGPNRWQKSPPGDTPATGSFADVTHVDDELEWSLMDLWQTH